MFVLVLFVPVRVCNCTELGYCYMEPGTHAWKFGFSTTLAILGGVLGFISKIQHMHIEKDLLWAFLYIWSPFNEKTCGAVTQHEGQKKDGMSDVSEEAHASINPVWFVVVILQITKLLEKLREGQIQYRNSPDRKICPRMHCQHHYFVTELIQDAIKDHTLIMQDTYGVFFPRVLDSLWIWTNSFKALERFWKQA